jgi:hypothetical protein
MLVMRSLAKSGFISGSPIGRMRTEEDQIFRCPKFAISVVKREQREGFPICNDLFIKLV